MKHYLQILSVALIVCLGSICSAAEPTRLRVLSYNIHHGEGVDGQLDLDRIAGVIRSVNPDLVSLQEVDKRARRTGSVDQPAELARLTDLNVAFGPNIELQGGHYGNAILSRHPISNHKNHLLPNRNAGEQRGVIVAAVDLPGHSEPLLLLATHLDHRRDDEERIASARAINALVSKDNRPALLAGDLNDVVGSETLDQFESVWTRTNDEALPTIPVGKPARQIDFILFRPQGRWKVVETKVLEEAVASDHRAIFAVLEFQ